jgi:hypothetical protein
MLSQSDLAKHGLEVMLELLPNQVLLSFVKGHQAINLASVLLPHQSGHTLAIGTLHRLASRELRGILCKQLIHLRGCV